MGIAEDMAREQLHVLPHLAFGIESPTGVVQIDALLGIQASILGGAKDIKGLSGSKAGIPPPECRQSYFSRSKLRCL